MSDSPDSKLCDALLQRYAQGKTTRANWDGAWSDVATFVLPRKRDTVAQPTNGIINGPARSQQRFDVTATDACRTMAAGLLSSLVPAGELWFRYSPRPGASNAVSKWLDDCTHRAATALTASNFYLAVHECLIDLSGFSIEGMFVEEGLAFEGKGDLLNFTQVPVGTFVIEEDAEQRVDTFFRTFFWTARQAVQKWGVNALGKEMREAFESKDPARQAQKFELVQAIFPRRPGDYRDGMVAADRRPVASVYIDVLGQHILENGGYYEMPVAVARLLREDNMIYGTGPSDEMMAEIRMLNMMRRDFLLAMELQVNPPWLGPNGNSWRPDNRPGGIIYWDTSNEHNKPERLRDTARLDFIDPAITDSRQIIRSGFFNDMFRLLSNPDVMKRDKTAYEVAQMVQEKLVLFHPMFARITRELLTPVLTRIFNVLLRRGAFLPPPVVDGEPLDYEINYVSKLALAIKVAQTNSVALMMQMLAGMVQFDPASAHVINWQKAAVGIARNHGVPAEWLRDEDEIAEIVRQQQQAAQMAQAEQAASAANQLAGAAQKLGPKGQDAAVKMLGG
ncbi:Bacteriophage head to tail connecting protein [Opitutaceae bacterium TAV1]|nr:Bacteriophage head to tail connecting protein [Opitutaceae bacterium TAV1]